MLSILRICWGVIVWIISIFYIRNSTGDGIYEDISNTDFQTLGSVASSKTSSSNRKAKPSKFGSFAFLIARLLLIGLLVSMANVAVGQNFDSDASFALIFFGCIALFLEFIALKEHEFPYNLSRSKENPVPEEPEPSEPLIELEQAVVYSISVPKARAWSGEQAYGFINQLLGFSLHWDFVIHGSADAITWEIWDWEMVDPDIIQPMIRANVPDAEIQIALHSFKDHLEPFHRYTECFRQVNMFIAPLQYATKIRKNDPLNPLINALNSLRKGEHVYFVLTLNGLSKTAQKRGKELITQSTIHPLQYLSAEGREDAFVRKVTQTDKARKFVGQEQQIFEAKLKASLINAALLIQIDTPDEQRLPEIGIAINTQMTHFYNEPYNALVPIEGEFEARLHRVEDAQSNQNSHFRKQRSNAPLLILEPLEMATFWHLPHQEMSASRIIWARSIHAIPEQIVRNETGINLGYGYQDLSRPQDIILPEEDRVTHMSIVGRTRMGKSNLMHHLIHQDIASGKGVTVIDPHGKLVKDILRSSIPTEREGDVVLLDLEDKAYPPPLNPLNQASHRTVLGVVSIIEKLFPDTEERARLSQTLRASLQLLAYQEQANMRDAVRLLMDDEYRENLLDQSDNPEIIDYWDFQYNNASSGQKSQLADPIVNRIRPFYGNTYLYPVICHPDRIDFQNIIENKKILLISLASDEDTIPKQERELIGSMLISRLQIAGMRHQEGNPYFIYIDEVQRFATTSLDIVFSEAAKYKLSLTIAHQYLEQLEGDLLNSILGNVGTNIVFRCSPKDSGKLMQYMQPEYQKHELSNLDKYQAAVKMQVEAQTQPAFTLFPHPPLEAPADADARISRIRKQAQSQLRSREEVLAWLNQRYPRTPRRGRASDKKAKPPEAPSDNNSGDKSVDPKKFIEGDDEQG